MSTYTIGEAAGRSGFSASAWRYYEAIGLVEPSARTESGYRLYDAAALARLAFIVPAKQLGCSLEEITDLVSVWDGDRCGPVQRRFHDLISGKIRDAQAQVFELMAFTCQLRTAAEQLSGEPLDGPCGPDSACLAGGVPSAGSDTSMVTLGRPPATVPLEVPIACSLEPGAMPDRLAEWSRVLAAATRRLAVAGGVRIEFGPDIDLGELGRLVGAEQRCCPFFGFTITVDAAATALEVRAPGARRRHRPDLFGAAA